MRKLVGRVLGGGTPRRSKGSYWNGSLPWASVKDFDDQSVELRSTEESITQRGLAASSSKLVPAGWPIVCTRMAVGRVACFERPVAINQDLKALEPNLSRVTPRFLLYSLKHLQPKLEAVAAGSTVKGISLATLLDQELFAPPLPAQRRIAEILDTMHETTRKTEEIIAKLEQLEKGLIDDLLTRGIDEDGHLREADQEPEQFKQVPAWPVRIPKDWKVVELSQIAKIDRGKFAHRPRNDPRFYGGDLPFIQTGDITGALGRVLHSYSQELNSRGAAVSREFPTGTIAVTIAANIADTAILGRPMYFPDSVVGVVVSEPNNQRFVELSIRRARTRLAAQAAQSAQKNINLQDLRPLPIALPTPKEQKRIAVAYGVFVTRLAQEERTLCKLQFIKRALMQDLLTGRVRVPVPEEAATS